MTDKAYIVANEQQEREVLEKLEREGLVWLSGENPTDYTPRKEISEFEFPHAITNRGYAIAYSSLRLLDNKLEIVYDGRKVEEEKMSEKYVVSQEFMNELEEWKDYCFEEYGVAINYGSIEDLPIVVNAWWGDDVPDKECNSRLIAIIRWVNGEDVFEVEKPKKWVVRSKETDEDDDYGYVLAGAHGISVTSYNISRATKFDTKEEAESWANAHQEIVSVEE